MASLRANGIHLGDTDGTWSASVEAGLAYALQLGSDVLVTEGDRVATCTPSNAREARRAKLAAELAWSTWYNSEPGWYRDWARANGQRLPAEPSTDVDMLRFALI